MAASANPFESLLGLSTIQTYMNELSGHAWASAENFPGEDNVEIFLIDVRLLTVQCKWTFTKRFTLSSPLVCAG